MKLIIVKKDWKAALGILGLIFFSINFSFGQDLHYSQFYNSPMNVNPALTGVFNGDKRVMGSFRDQWRSVAVPWTTFSASYDQKIFFKNADRTFMSAGVLLNYDQQGDSNISLTNVNLALGLSRIVSKAFIINIGGIVGYANRGFDVGSLRWDAQWNGISFDPNLPIGEQFNATTLNFLETAAGINFRFQRSTRTKLDLGGAIYHIAQPQAAFDSMDDISLPRRFSFTGQGSAQIASKFDLILSGLYQIQDSYEEIVGGLHGKFYLSEKRGSATKLYVGAGYRLSESLFPKIAIEYNDIYVGFSYDIDLSDFETATNNRGGPEIHFRYIIKNVKPLGHFKACPIY